MKKDLKRGKKGKRKIPESGFRFLPRAFSNLKKRERKGGGKRGEPQPFFVLPQREEGKGGEA